MDMFLAAVGGALLLVFAFIGFLNCVIWIGEKLLMRHASPDAERLRAFFPPVNFAHPADLLKKEAQRWQHYKAMQEQYQEGKYD